MRAPKQGDSPSGYDREVRPRPKRTEDAELRMPLVALAHIAERVAEIGDTGTPLPLRDPRELAGSIEGQAQALLWSVLQDGQRTEHRAVELAAYCVGFLMARARAAETDIAAGDDA